MFVHTDVLYDDPELSYVYIKDNKVTLEQIGKSKSKDQDLTN